MGGAASKKETESETSETVAEQSTVNIGFVNTSSQNTAFMDNPTLWRSIEVISAIILIFLALRWIKKWWTRRGTSKLEDIEKQITTIVARVRQPEPAQLMIQPAIAQPTLPVYQPSDPTRSGYASSFDKH